MSKLFDRQKRRDTVALDNPSSHRLSDAYFLAGEMWDLTKPDRHLESARERLKRNHSTVGVVRKGFLYCLEGWIGALFHDRQGATRYEQDSSSTKIFHHQTTTIRWWCVHSWFLLDVTPSSNAYHTSFLFFARLATHNRQYWQTKVKLSTFEPLSQDDCFSLVRRVLQTRREKAVYLVFLWWIIW